MVPDFQAGEFAEGDRERVNGCPDLGEADVRAREAAEPRETATTSERQRCYAHCLLLVPKKSIAL
jgi:hypothetical protein